MTYSDKLKNPKWQKKRLEILERDGWTCQKCGDTEETLHVHHYYYENGKNPWDYSDTTLITLCATCHKSIASTKKEYEQDILYAIQLLNFSMKDYFGLLHGLHAINPDLRCMTDYRPDFVEALRKAILLLKEEEENALVQT